MRPDAARFPALRALAGIVRADFLERVRRHAFLVTLGVAVWFTYVSLPPNEAHYVTLQIANARGVYDSAWVGAVAAILTSVFLAIAGFYLVKNAVERDRATGVGQILAATPLGKPLYTLGKAASNFAVLAAIVAAVAIASAGMQLLRGEDSRLDVVALLLPHLFVTLPAMTVIAATAVLFESIPALAGGFGNVAWFFAAMLLVIAPSTGALERRERGDDLLGMGLLVSSMRAAHDRAYPEDANRSHAFSIGFNIKSEGVWSMKTFRWPGAPWSLGRFVSRLRWVALAAGIALAAAIPFDRFDSTRAPRRRGRRGPPARETVGDAATVVDAAIAAPASAPAHAADLPIAKRGAGLGGLVLSEMRLLLREAPRAWRIVALGLIVAELLVPRAIARGWILPFAWIWPLLLWSGMGSRERSHGVAPLLASAPHPIGRQLVSTWLAGVALTLATGLGVGVRHALAGDATAVVAWLTGALFVPSLAIALGEWSGSGKLFEVLYTALWYLGPMNHVAFLDYAGVVPGSSAWPGFAAAAAALLGLAALARRHRLTR